MPWVKRKHKHRLDPELVGQLPPVMSAGKLSKTLKVSVGSAKSWVKYDGLPARYVPSKWRERQYVMVIDKDDFVRWAVETKRLVMP